MSGTIKRDRKEYFKEYHEKNKEKRNALSAIRREEKRDEINEEKRNITMIILSEGLNILNVVVEDNISYARKRDITNLNIT